MECTQRLECTQVVNETHTERVCPEQVGFLGICGKTYPVLHGPNKIGRDPQTCNIVLNLNSVSRQHAVINILNKTDFMLMDLDSANKTKLLNKTLQAYIPQPLRNGDTVQFGEIFGIFRLLEETDDLPMTQAMDVPETPVFTKHMSRLNKAPITTVPESPDVSDRDDSFIVATQSKVENHFKSTNNDNFIRPASKTISIQPIGSNKIDNVFWNSSKKSTSLSMQLNDSNCNNNDSVLSTPADKSVATPNKDIFEMETQPPLPNRHNESSDSIYTADTQIPSVQESPLIHSLETQLPIPPTEHLPEVRKIHTQKDMQFDLYSANKENENSIFNAETQMFPSKNKIPVKPNHSSHDKDGSASKEKSNISDEELLFDEIDNEYIEEDFCSQALLPQDISPKIAIENVVDNKAEVKKLDIQPVKRVERLKSDSSTDCEDLDVALTQKIPEKKVCVEDDLTDCEDDFIELNTDKSKKLNDSTKSNLDIDLEDMPTQVIGEVEAKDSKIDDLEDMATQVIEVIKVGDRVTGNNESKDDIVDLCSQDENISNNPGIPQIPEETISPFKVPLHSYIKVKRKDIFKDTPKVTEAKTPDKSDDENFYANTQELYGDLDSQRAMSPEIVTKSLKIQRSKQKNIHDIDDDEVLPSSVEDYKVGDKFPHLENKLSPKKFVIADKSSGSSDGEDKVQKFVSNLSSQQIRDVIGVAKMKKLPSDCSDVDLTPKKIRPFKLMDMDLPDSQEIKTSVTIKTHSLVTESSSESEVENNSEEQNTPILFKKKKKRKIDAKIDLTKKFNVALPTRVITRVRKPTNKMLDNESNAKSNTEDIVDNEIIHENLARLKRHDKSKELKSGETKVTVKKERKSKEKMQNEVKNESDKKKDIVKIKTTEVDSVDKTNESKRDNVKKESIQKINESIENEDVPNISSRRSMRSSRIKRKHEKESKSPEEEDSKRIKKESKPKRTYKKREQKREPSPEEDSQIRRSKRQRAVKEKKEDIVNVKIKSILKNSNTAHEHSAVYNLSSGSDSPKGIKRSGRDDFPVPSAKKTRSTASSNSVIRPTPSRTPSTQYVLFTAFPWEEVAFKLEQLGAVKVTDVAACTVVLTSQIKRTFKLLCAVGLGKPIVGPAWVQACADANSIVDPWLHLIKDEVAEKRFKFNLSATLNGKRNFLKGYNISSTPSVLPDATELKQIVECSGGKWKEESPHWVCVSSTADKALWPQLRKKGATIVSTEFILGGVLKQKLDIYSNKF